MDTHPSKQQRVLVVLGLLVPAVIVLASSIGYAAIGYALGLTIMFGGLTWQAWIVSLHRGRVLAGLVATLVLAVATVYIVVQLIG